MESRGGSLCNDPPNHCFMVVSNKMEDLHLIVL